MIRSSEVGSGCILACCSAAYRAFAFQKPNMAKIALPIVAISNAKGDVPASQNPNTLASPVDKMMFENAPSRSCGKKSAKTALKVPSYVLLPIPSKMYITNREPKLQDSYDGNSRKRSAIKRYDIAPAVSILSLFGSQYLMYLTSLL